MQAPPRHPRGFTEEDVGLLLRGEPEAFRRGFVTALQSLAAPGADQVDAAAAALDDRWWENPTGTLDPRVAAGLATLHQAATQVDGGTDGFALYVREIVEQAWERSWDQRALRDVVEEALRVGGPDGTDSPAWALLALLRHEFSAFAATLTGHLDLVEDTAGRCVDVISQALRRFDGTASTWTPPAPGVWTLLRAELVGELDYYVCLVEAAHAARLVLTREPLGRQALGAAMTTLRTYLREGDHAPEDVSEIRNHLAALESFERALGPTSEDRYAVPWLRVDQGEIVVTYPFGVRWPSSTTGTAVVQAVRADNETGPSRAASAPWVLAGMAVVDSGVGELDLEDSWSVQGDVHLARRYRGVQLTFPDLVLRRVREQADQDSGHTTASVEVSHTIGVQVRFSELGNHHLRFTIPLEDALPAAPNEAALVCSPLFGDTAEIEGLELIAEGGTGARWSRLSEVAEQMVEDIRCRMAESFERAAPTAPGSEAPRITWRPDLCFVLTVVSRATRFVRDGDVGEPVIDARELRNLFGVEPLMHPTPGGAISIADWASYDLDGSRTGSTLALNRELLCANSNVVLLACFHSPLYAVLTVRSFVEFAHSLHGLHAGWEEEIADHGNVLGERLDRLVLALRRLDENPTGPGHTEARAEVDWLVGLIEAAQLRLKRFLVSAQVTQHFIESPALVTSAPLRADIDTILDLTGFGSLTSAFDRARDEVIGDRVHDLLEAARRRIELREERRRARREAEDERRASRARLVGEVLALAVGVVGISGVLSLVQEGYPFQDRVAATTVLVAVVLGLTALAVLAVLVLHRRDIPVRRDRGVQVLTDLQAIGDVHDRVLAPAFSPDELVPREQLLADVAAGRSEVLAVLDGRGDPLAAAVGDFIGDVALLGYLATSRGSRSAGLGGELLDAAVQRWRARTRRGASAISLVVAEVEDPRHHDPDPVRGDPARRLGFYARHGARRLDLPYVQPALRAETEKVAGMLLLVLAADEALVSADGTRLASTRGLARFLDDYVGALSGADDPDYRRLRRAAEAPDGIRLLPLA